MRCRIRAAVEWSGWLGASDYPEHYRAVLPALPRPLDRARSALTRRSERTVAIRITFRHTLLMAKAISVRLDDDAERALRILEATGLSRSAAIRSALLASAERVRKRSELAAEAAALEADEADRAEMLSIASMMEAMRAAG
jgi:Arc/MetJ-type ribon-helix-helix transcriptional regulator